MPCRDINCDDEYCDADDYYEDDYYEDDYSEGAGRVICRSCNEEDNLLDILTETTYCQCRIPPGTMYIKVETPLATLVANKPSEEAWPVVPPDEVKPKIHS